MDVILVVGNFYFYITISELGLGDLTSGLHFSTIGPNALYKQDRDNIFITIFSLS